MSAVSKNNTAEQYNFDTSGIGFALKTERTAILMTGINGYQRVTVNIDRKIFSSEEVFSKLGDYIHEELEMLQNLAIIRTRTVMGNTEYEY
ncbi:unnamed protein product [Allacma fusca]|uniref:Uncharacterized protein n=1 Tax=Allacma fusca TaxID=39272 RepID=A0A8J2M8R1_9HEXA|nr:unnamed protein product [Allacma fusca]